MERTESLLCSLSRLDRYIFQLKRSFLVMKRSNLYLVALCVLLIGIRFFVTTISYSAARAQGQTVTLWKYITEKDLMVPIEVKVEDGSWSYIDTGRDFFGVSKLDSQGNLMASGWTLFLPEPLEGIAVESNISDPDGNTAGILPYTWLTQIPFPQNIAPDKLEGNTLQLHDRKSVFFEWGGKTFMVVKVHSLSYDILDGQGNLWNVLEDNVSYDDGRTISFPSDWVTAWWQYTAPQEF